MAVKPTETPTDRDGRGGGGAGDDRRGKATVPTETKPAPTLPTAAPLTTTTETVPSSPSGTTRGPPTSSPPRITWTQSSPPSSTTAFGTITTRSVESDTTRASSASSTISPTTLVIEEVQPGPLIGYSFLGLLVIAILVGCICWLCKRRKARARGAQSANANPIIRFVPGQESIRASWPDELVENVATDGPRRLPAVQEITTEATSEHSKGPNQPEQGVETELEAVVLQYAQVRETPTVAVISSPKPVSPSSQGNRSMVTPDEWRTNPKIDGPSICRMINRIAPGTIDESIIAIDEHSSNPRAKRDNLTLALNSARAIGLNIDLCITADDLVNNEAVLVDFVRRINRTGGGGDSSIGLQQAPLEETSEEASLRNWINAMGVKPRVNCLRSDLKNGLILFQIYDNIRPGIVKWEKVHKKFNKLNSMFEEIENCQYSIDLGKELQFSLVGIGGKDLYEGNYTLTQALLWQLMRAYSMSILAKCSGRPIAESDVVAWANRKLTAAGKYSTFVNFHDARLGSGRAMIDLVDSIRPGIVNYNSLRIGGSAEAHLANARYALNAARMIGAEICVFAEDVVAVNSRMLLLIFASLMGCDYRLSSEKAA